jgi:hypothetical protein
LGANARKGLRQVRESLAAVLVRRAAGEDVVERLLCGTTPSRMIVRVEPG